MAWPTRPEPPVTRMVELVVVIIIIYVGVGCAFCDISTEE